MSRKTYWNLLVIFGVLCQGIADTLSGKDIDESSQLLVRQKRVGNRTPRIGDIRDPIRNSPYVVTVRKFRSQKYCTGVILSENVVLTVAECVAFNILYGKVYSGGAQRPIHRYSSNYVVHNITDKRVLMNNHTSRLNDGIALITVTPDFIYSINTRNIQLAEGHNQHGLNGTVSGWGCNAVGDHGTAQTAYLRLFTVPIITNRVCARLYGNIFKILDSDLCTLDATGKQYCGVNDAGAPLVINDARNVNKLTGIHLWRGQTIGRAYPDIFANVQHPIYRTWIADTIRSLNQNHHT